MATPKPMLQASAKQCSQAKPPSKARTYVRTYVQLLTLGSYVTLGNARRGVAGFRPIWVENRRAACAARGLMVVAR